jgi:hypothetical protein
MKMGAVSAQHIVGGHKYSFKRQEISWHNERLASRKWEVLNEIAYLISQFVWLHKAKTHFHSCERGHSFFATQMSAMYISMQLCCCPFVMQNKINLCYVVLLILEIIHNLQASVCWKYPLLAWQEVLRNGG